MESDCKNMNLNGNSIEGGWIVDIKKGGFYPSYLYAESIKDECCENAMDIPNVPMINAKQHLQYAAISDIYNVINHAFHATTSEVFANMPDKTEKEDAIHKYHQQEELKYKSPLQKQKLMTLFKQLLDMPNSKYIYIVYILKCILYI